MSKPPPIPPKDQKPGAKPADVSEVKVKNQRTPYLNRCMHKLRLLIKQGRHLPRNDRTQPPVAVGQPQVGMKRHHHPILRVVQHRRPLLIPMQVHHHHHQCHQQTTKGLESKLQHPKKTIVHQWSRQRKSRLRRIKKPVTYKKSLLKS